MNTEVKIPTVGESVTEVTIAQWLKKEGEQVKMDDVLCELESDKATFELTAEQTGILHIKANEGETLEIGAVIAEIEPNGEGKPDKKSEKPADKDTGKKAEKPAATEKTGEVVEMKVPAVGESITEVTIGTWAKKNGDLVEPDEVLVEIESDKATFELTAENRGILTIVAKEGETLGVGDLICKIEVVPGDAADGEKPKEPEEADGGDGKGESYAAGHASPAAAKILAEKGIDADTITGSGIDGRITKEDALKAQAPAPSPEKEKEKEKEETAVPDAAPRLQRVDRGQRREKMSTLRKTIARRLVSVKNEMAMLTTFNEVDMKPVMDLRSKYKERFKEKYQVNLGFMSFFVKASCQALLEWPMVNAMIDGEEIVYNDFCDISVAVSTPRGLVVPVIRNAERLSFEQIEKEINRLAMRAREGKISIDEMSGGTFTITNGGVFGSMLSTPIINAPQSAILGMHNIVERPVAINGEVVVRPVMYVAISYDHRLIDGREAVSFLVRIKELLEDPSRLLLGI
jgi:2-oxoglutarate dehydrogenase E2 component (dihydrolipoamide succinyltransferase)